MKARIISAEKQTLPQYNQLSGIDEPTLMVVTTVAFFKDEDADAEGAVPYLTQKFAQRPEEVDQDNPTAYFDRQANILQAELDGQQANAETQAQSQLADQIVEKLTNINGGQ